MLIAGGNVPQSQQSAELFNPAGDTFTALPASGSTELQMARSYAGAAVLPNGTVLIAGGVNSTGEPRGAELFFPAPTASAQGGAFGDVTVGARLPRR